MDFLISFALNLAKFSCLKPCIPIVCPKFLISIILFTDKGLKIFSAFGTKLGSISGYKALRKSNFVLDPLLIENFGIMKNIALIFSLPSTSLANK